MAIRDLVPWNNRGREMSLPRGEERNPFLSLHREMNRLFDDVFRDLDLASFGMGRFENSMWPHVEVSETDREGQSPLSFLDSKKRTSRSS